MSKTATYTNLESGLWTPVVGPTINAVSANGYTVLEADGLRLYATGPAWGGWLAKHTEPTLPLPVTGQVQFSFDILPDDAVKYNAQALEFDNRLTDANGYNYNWSSQLNLAEDGAMQIVDANGHWIDTGFKPGPFPETWTTVQYVYSFDTAKHLFSVESIAVGNQSALVPATLKGIPAQKLNWAPNEIVTQIQQDLKGNGGAFSQKMRNITIAYSW